MKDFKVLALISLLTLSATNVFSYDVVNRYKLIDDKLKTEQMLRPFGHDFFLDIGAAMNKNAKDVVNDISDVSKQTTNAAKLSEAQRILTKYDKTEQTIKLNVALGVPIFKFSAWDVKFQPNLRVFVDAGANLGIRKDTLSCTDVLNLMSEQVPSAMESQLVSVCNSKSAGDDLFGNCAVDFPSPAEVRAFCDANVGKFFKPDPTIPNLNLLGKVDGKVGFFNDYTSGDHFFGNFDLYFLSRTDIFQTITYASIANGSKIDFPKKKNTESTIEADYRLGYKNDNYKVFASIEELKLAKLKERDTGSKALSYGYDPLIRLHADALYRLGALSLNPFAGLHKRTGYGFMDGMYLGADAGAHLWGDRLGVQLRGMLDKQYFTVSPRLKLWLMQLEYSLKSPLKSMDGDVKLSALHSVDLRFFF